jgi:predicted peroxiredoxin
MGRLLVHVVTGPENATRAALGMLVARAALAAGHEVDVFFAGDAVALLRDETLAALTGVGTGSAREHFDALSAGGAGLYASRLSADARGMDLEALTARGIAPSPPDRLVELTFLADRILAY